MKTFIVFVLSALLLLLINTNAQDSGMFNAGNFGGPVTWGIPNGSDIYFSQGNKLRKGIEGSQSIEVVSSSILRDAATQIKIDGDNLYAIYGTNSEYKNSITNTTLSNLGSSSSNNFSGIDNGINKFDEIDGFGLLAHNKDGVLSDKLVGEDLLGNTNDSFEYVVDFIDFTINEYTAYLITDDGTANNTIEIIDFSAKTSANKVGSIQVKNAKSVFYSDGHIFVACVNGEGVKVIDVSTPSTPTLVGEYSPDTFSQVIVDGTTAYLRNENVLTILNVSNPTNPTFVSTKTFNDRSAATKFTAVQNGKIYYADNGIFGIIETGTLTLGQQYLSPTSSDWVAADETTLVVYDKASYYFHSLDDPYNPKAYAVLAADFEPVDFVINGNDFYATTNNKLSIYDIENLATPSADFNYFGEFSAFKITNDFAVIGEYKYSASTIFYYFEIIDLTDKSNPTQLHLEDYATIGTITSIELSPDNNTLYLASELEGKIWLTIFDITNKSAPTKVYAEKIETITSDTIDGKDTRLGINGTELYLVTNYVTLNSYNAAKIFAYSVEESSNPRLIAGLQITESEYSNVVFFNENLLIAVPNDKEIHMYSLEGDSTFRKEWNQIETLTLENEHANMASYLNKPTPTSSAPKGSKFNKILGDEWDYISVVISEKRKGTELIQVYVKKKVVTKVQLTTSVLPAEAATGGCSVSPSGGEYDKNDVVSISANAATGWVFDNWSGDLTGSASPSNLTMSSNKNVIGNFKPILELAFNSADSQNIAVPKHGEQVFIGGALLTANGTDWKLNGITFTALEKIKPTYTRAFINYDGSTKEGTFTLDGDGYIETINFVLSKEIPEDYTLIINFYYMFEFPPNEEGLLAPLDEIKKLGISYNRAQVNCDPIPSIEGVKIPQDTFSSNYQTIGWIWNTSLTPNEPFMTIQDAISDPRTLDGHEIQVWEGYYKYNSTIEIPKNLRIKGIGYRENIIVEVMEKLIFNILPSTFAIRINNFTFQNSYSGISSKNSKLIYIEDCTFDKLTEKCIISEGDEDININRNTFVFSETSDINSGIYANIVKSIDISTNIFENTNIGSSLIVLNQASGSCRISNNTDIERRGSFSSGFGKSPILTIENNELGEIWASNSQKIILKKNKINFVKLSNVDNSIIDDNIVEKRTDYIENSRFYGIDVENSNNIEISNNVVTNCSDDGIKVNDSPNAKIIENTIMDVGANGILVSGLRLFSTSSYNYNPTIKYNKVSGCKNGIVLFRNNKAQIIENKVFSNNEVGIWIGHDYYGGANNSKVYKNRVEKNGTYGVLLRGSSKNCIIESNVIKENESDGIRIFEAFSTKVVSNSIYNHTNQGTGISSNVIYDWLLVEGNVLTNNCRGISFNNHEIANGKLIARNNTIRDSYCSRTGIHIESGEAELTGNDISGNNGAGIALYNDATAEISRNNIYDNPDLAILNDNPNTNISVDNNYWGATSGPGDNDFSSGIHFTSWLNSPISLVISKVSDTLKTAIGLTDSMDIGFLNFVIPNDQIEVTVTDEKGWLTNGSTTQVDLTDTTISLLPIKFKVPSDAGSSFNNKVKISAVSKTNSEMTAVDSFYILNYTPQLASIKVSPDSIALGLGGSLQFRVSASDQYGKEFSGITILNWIVSAGTIDTTGYFIADSTSQIVTITATETNSNITANANINVQAHTDIATITIYPDSIVVPIDGTIQFYAKGKDENGFDVEFNKLWLAVGGTVDSVGSFTAGDTEGEYFVKVRDGISNAEATAKVIIVKPTGVESERIIPKEYSLNQNYPNPFNPSTTISYGLPFESKVKVEIFNVLGQRVDVITNQLESAGLHSTLWDAGHLASGIYIIRINATSVNSSNNFVKSIKMLLLK